MAIDYTQALRSQGDMYSAILQGFQEREKNLGTNLEALGSNQRQQAQDYYKQYAAATDQSAISRGLGNSTVRNSLQQGVNRQRDSALAEINNNIAQQRLNYGQQWSGDILNFMAQQYGQQQGLALNREQLALQREQLRAQQQAQQGQLALGYAQLNNRSVGGGGGGGGVRNVYTYSGGGGDGRTAHSSLLGGFTTYR